MAHTPINPTTKETIEPLLKSIGSILINDCLLYKSPPEGVDPADCDKAQAEMRNLRWSYLNEDYYKGVNDTWITGGCMDRIIREMGYRICLLYTS